jgi:hypothetical protein
MGGGVENKGFINIFIILQYFTIEILRKKVEKNEWIDLTQKKSLLMNYHKKGSFLFFIIYAAFAGRACLFNNFKISG